MKEKKQIINELVEKFERNLNEYKHPSYNETQIRIEFVYPENQARQEGKSSRETVSDLTHILNHSNAKIGEKTWSREDLHER